MDTRGVPFCEWIVVVSNASLLIGAFYACPLGRSVHLDEVSSESSLCYVQYGYGSLWSFSGFWTTKLYFLHASEVDYVFGLKCVVRGVGRHLIHTLLKYVVLFLFAIYQGRWLQRWSSQFNFYSNNKRQTNLILNIIHIHTHPTHDSPPSCPKPNKINTNFRVTWQSDCMCLRRWISVCERTHNAFADCKIWGRITVWRAAKLQRSPVKTAIWSV